MFVVKLGKVLSVDDFYGVKVYNKMFEKFKGDFYIPIFYDVDFINRLKFKPIFKRGLSLSKKELYGEFSSLYFDYMNEKMYNAIEKVFYDDSIVNVSVPDYLVYKVLFEFRKDLFSKDKLRFLSIVDKYTMSQNFLRLLVIGREINSSNLFYGTFYEPVITSGEVLLGNSKVRVAELEKIFDKLFFEDFNVVLDKGVYKIVGCRNVGFSELNRPTDNTVVSMVFPYLYVIGVIGEGKAIVNKYKFNPRGHGYFELVKAKVVANSIRVDGERVGKRVSVKEFGDVEKLGHSIWYFKSLKNVLSGEVMPLYYDGFAYLFLKSKTKYEWVSKIKAESMELTVNKRAYEKFGLDCLHVKVNNRVVCEYYNFSLFNIINPACEFPFSAGGRLYCVMLPHPLRVKKGGKR